MALAATEKNKITPQKGTHVASVKWKWFNFASSDLEQMTMLLEVVGGRDA